MFAAMTTEPRPVTLQTINVTVEVVLRRRIETFRRTINSGEQALRDLVDYFEGDVGTVLSIQDDSGKTLFRAGFEPWEAGVQ